MPITLSRREAEFLEILWERGSCTVAEMRDELEDESAYTTILTILRVLQAKGYVEATKDGHAHRYAPAITRDAARQGALADLAMRLFRGSTELLLTHLVSERKMTAAEIKRIRRLLSQQSRKAKR